MNICVPTGVFQNEITDSSAWESEDLCPSQSWNVSLTEEQVDDLLFGLEQIKHLQIAEINSTNFPIPKCQYLIKEILDQLKIGRGFSLMHGFPVKGISDDDIARMYWGFCTHLGNGVTQGGTGATSYGGLINNVTEGKIKPNEGSRKVGSPSVVKFHNDPADTVMLLCIRQAVDSPKSKLVSTSTIHNKLNERVPEQMHRLYVGFPHHHQDMQYETESPTTVYPVPIFSQANNLVSSQYNRFRIKLAADMTGGMSHEDNKLLDLVDEIAEENAFSFEFQPGDIQFANNYVIWHGREGHTPAKGEHDTRHLMRIWTYIDNFRTLADDEVIRYSCLKYGSRGRYAEDVLKDAGIQINPRETIV